MRYRRSLPPAIALMLLISSTAPGCMFGLTTSVETDEMSNGERERQRTGIAITGLVVLGAVTLASVIYVAVKHPKATANAMANVSRQYTAELRRQRAVEATRARNAERARKAQRDRDRRGSPSPDRGGFPSRDRGGQDRSSQSQQPDRGSGAGRDGANPSSTSTSSGRTGGSGSPSGSGTSSTGGSATSSSTGSGATSSGQAKPDKPPKRWVQKTWLSKAFDSGWTYYYRDRGMSERNAKDKIRNRAHEECRAQFDNAASDHSRLAYGQLECVQGGSDNVEWRCRYPRAIAMCEKGVME